MEAVRLVVLVGVLGACAHQPSIPTCGSGWAPLQDERGRHIAWTAPDRDTVIGSVEIAGVGPALHDTLVAVLATRRGQRLEDAPLKDDLRTLWGARRDLRRTGRAHR